MTTLGIELPISVRSELERPMRRNQLRIRKINLNFGRLLARQLQAEKSRKPKNRQPLQ
jgi:hypothetical protein